MALEYGYFDSEITGYDDEGMPEFDRAKSSDFMADFFSKLITSGVLASPSTCFQVTAYDGLTVAIAPGYAFVEGRFAYDEDTAYLTLEDAPTVSSQSRIDMIVLRNNYADRLCEIVVKTGTAAASPEEPTLLSNGDYYELCLAKITVSSNQTELSQSNITDTRYDTSYCGPVTQLIDSVDTSTLFAQFEASMSESLASVSAWLENIKDILSDDVAANLQLEIEELQQRCADLEAEDRDITCGSLTVTENSTINGTLDVTGEATVNNFRVPETQHGYIDVTPDSAGATTSAEVTFDTAFSGTPTVTATVQTTAPNSRAVGVLSISATGFTVYVYSSGSGTVRVHWIAVY